MRWGLVVIGIVLLACCRNEPATDADGTAEVKTRFDDLEAKPEVRRASRRSVARAVGHARSGVATHATRALSVAVAELLTEVPTTDGPPGKPVGTVVRDGRRVALHLYGNKGKRGALLAEFDARHSDDGNCGESTWVPEWTPAVGWGSGTATSGESNFVWWQFEEEGARPMLLRFGPQGVALWRTGPGGDCYSGESFLALAAGGVAVDDYVTPTAVLGNAAPAESGETEDAKPVRADLLQAQGDEIFTARDGVAELRTARKKLVKRWKSEVGVDGCAQAAFHRFDGEQPHLYFEVDFTDSSTCDEDWGARHGLQSLYRVDAGELVEVLSSSVTDVVDDEGRAALTTEFRVVIPTGDGALEFRGKGKSEHGETGGDSLLDCGPWLRDSGRESAAVAFTVDDHTGSWLFRTPEQTHDVGRVSANSSTAVCGLL